MSTFSRIFNVFAVSTLAACLSASLRADTPSPTATEVDSPTVTLTATPTPTSTVTPTVTATPTLPPGSYSVTVQGAGGTSYLVPGSSYNSLSIVYTANVQFGTQGTDGELSVVLPSDFGAPTLTNFTWDPSSSVAIDGPAVITGQTVTVNINGNLQPGGSLVFNYANSSLSSPTGFMYSGPTSASPTGETVQVWANALSDTNPGVQVPTPAPIPVFTVTASPSDSPTISPTYTPSPSFTVSPTISPTSTASPSFTNTPVGAIWTKGFYTYPNPFDKRAVSQVTVRYQPTQDSVQIDIFNLLGNPVRRIPAGNIQAGLGLASWSGDDDDGRQVPGGLYFIRLKVGSTTTVRKMTVFY